VTWGGGWVGLGANKRGVVGGGEGETGDFN